MKKVIISILLSVCSATYVWADTSESVTWDLSNLKGNFVNSEISAMENSTKKLTIVSGEFKNFDYKYGSSTGYTADAVIHVPVFSTSDKITITCHYTCYMNVSCCKEDDKLWSDGHEYDDEPFSKTFTAQQDDVDKGYVAIECKENGLGWGSFFISIKATYFTHNNISKIFTSVQQNGAKIETLGTAAFDLTDNPTVEFVDGKAVMKIGDNTVAVLPMDNGGQLVVDFTTSLAEDELNKVSKTVTEAGYATIYSPFQLQVPASGVEVYAPTYDSENHVLKCNESTKVNEEILPAGAGLLLKNAGTVDFAISAGTATAVSKGDLSGSALTIPTSSVAVESGNAIYTLGHPKQNKDLFGFFKYSGENLNAGVAYLIAPAAGSAAKEEGVMLSFGDDSNAIESIATMTNSVAGKFIENGRVVIMKAGHKF
ncbi:MAG: hypothetical protein Q4F34_02445, partial [Prevotellaceae bacterium]|nr:hypothetical protein [Prevotellaceae bacterium]